MTSMDMLAYLQGLALGAVLGMVLGQAHPAGSAGVIVAAMVLFLYAFRREKALRAEDHDDEPDYHCEDCDAEADCGVPRAPGMGTEYYCRDHCPRCNFPGKEADGQ